MHLKWNILVCKKKKIFALVVKQDIYNTCKLDLKCTYLKSCYNTQELKWAKLEIYQCV